MYLPRADKIFGSEYILLRHKEKMENGTEFHQIYDVERANWESLDSQEKRCDSENKNYEPSALLISLRIILVAQWVWQKVILKWKGT